jgi:hypothetical protein
MKTIGTAIVAATLLACDLLAEHWELASAGTWSVYSTIGLVVFVIVLIAGGPDGPDKKETP